MSDNELYADDRRQPEPDSCDASQIRSLLGKIGQYSDAAPLDIYIELFTKDAVWGMRGGHALRGRAEILSAAEQRRIDKVTGPDSDSMHVVTMSIIDVEGTHAVGQSVFQFYGDVSHSPRLVAMGRYHDTFQKLQADWKLKSREIELVTVSAAPKNNN